MIASHCVSAYKVLQVQSAPPRFDVPFLNYRLKALPRSLREPLPGAGVYGVFVDKSLSYVGKYLGRRVAPHKGDVVTDRWWAHVSTMTMRGYRVSLARRSLEALSRRVALPDEYQALLVAADQIAKDNGCMAGFNRACFALEHWDTFGRAWTDDHNVLRRFEFVYVRYLPEGQFFPEGKRDCLRQLVSRIEKRVIQRFRPPCNDEIVWGEGNDQTTADEFELFTTTLMRRAARFCSMGAA